MYRILSASKDTYITNKLVVGSASLLSNVGQAGTLDLFKLYNETETTISGDLVELSRILLAFDYGTLQSLTSSILNVGTGSFQALLNVRNIYGGQTLPSNFTVSLFPLARSFDEGRGMDVKAFRDLDTANWLTASTGNPWTITGCMASGNLGDTNIDYYLSGNLGFGSQSLEITQTFGRGDEDLVMDITQLVSASIVGILPNNGFRLSFTSSQETDNVTRFVKRFGSRHTLNANLHPRIQVKYDDHIEDDNNTLFFNVANNVFYYNRIGSALTNFVSGSTLITGSDSLLLTLVASKSVVISTSSFQLNFSASITYNTTSVEFYSTSVSASLFSLGDLPQTGIYFAPLFLDVQSDVSLSNFLGGNSSITFASYWQSLDKTIMFATGSWLTVKLPQGSDSNVLEHNWVTNVTNLKSLYTNSEIARLRVFVQDYNTEQVAFKLPTQTRSTIVKNMRWRLVNAFDRTVVIPFDSVATRLSYDGQGMYFDMYMQDLDLNKVYELEFEIIEDGKSYLITNQGFRFKVVP